MKLSIDIYRNVNSPQTNVENICAKERHNIQYYIWKRLAFIKVHSGVFCPQWCETKMLKDFRLGAQKQSRNTGIKEMCKED